MKPLIIVMTLLVSPFTFGAGQQLSCHFPQFYGSEFLVDLKLDQNGGLEKQADAVIWGGKQTISIDAVQVPAEDARKGCWLELLMGKAQFPDSAPIMKISSAQSSNPLDFAAEIWPVIQSGPMIPIAIGNCIKSGL